MPYVLRGVIFLFLLLLAQRLSAQVVMTEIAWAGSDLSSSDEWVELTALSPLSLSGWTLTGKNSSGIETQLHRFIGETPVNSGDILILSSHTASSSRLLAEPFLVNTKIVLSNTRLLLRLRDSQGTIIDTVGDGLGDPYAGANPTGGINRASMERIDMSAPGNVTSNWVTSLESRGFDDGARTFGTPGFRYTIPTPPRSLASEVGPIPSLTISEVLPDPEGSDDAEWIELQNIGNEVVYLRNIEISTLQGGQRFSVPNSSGALTLAPNSLLLFPKSQSKLNLRNAGDTVILKAGNSEIDRLSYPDLPEGISFGRLTGMQEPRMFCVPTPASLNTVVTSSHHIQLQSGNFEGNGPLSVNVTAAPEDSSLDAGSCRWDFGDGSESDSCNPPSHTYEEPGEYSLTLRFTDQCINTLVQEVPIRVYGKPKSSSASLKQSYTSGSSSLLLVAALPNPEGPDDRGEWIEILNTSDQPVSMAGWSLFNGRKKVSKVFDLVWLAPHQRRRFWRRETGLTLPNSPAEIHLVDPAGLIRSRLHWSQAKSGKVYRQQEDHSARVHGFAREVKEDGSISVDLVDAPLEMVDLEEVRVKIADIDIAGFGTLLTLGQYKIDALNFIRALIEDKEIELQFDSYRPSKGGAYLAEIFVGDVSVSEQLLRRGLARSTVSNHRIFEASAQAWKLGIWVVASAADFPQEEGLIAMQASLKSSRSKRSSSSKKSKSSKSRKAAKPKTKKSKTAGNVFAGIEVAEASELTFSPSSQNATVLSTLFTFLSGVALTLAVQFWRRMKG